MGFFLGFRQLKITNRFKSGLNNLKKKYSIPNLKTTSKFENLAPVVLYEHNNRAHVAAVRAIAFLQGLFWINYGHLAYTKLGKKDEETGEVWLYEEWKRSLAFGSSIFIGAVFGGCLILYSKRCIFKATLFPKDNLVKIESDCWPLRDRVEYFNSSKLVTQVSIQDIKSCHKSTPNNKFLLRSADKQKMFILDSRGQFGNPNLFDSLFYEPKFSPQS